MKKTIIKNSVTINVDKDKLWDILSDFGNVQNLSPGIAKSYLTSETKNGLGATRHCDFTSMGSQVEEKIIGWNKGKSFKIELYDTKNIPMMKEMNAFFELETEKEGTKLTTVFEYQMNNVVGKIFNNLKMKSMNEKSWLQFLAGIKHYSETGETVDEKTNLDLSTVKSI